MYNNQEVLVGIANMTYVSFRKCDYLGNVQIGAHGEYEENAADCFDSV